MVGVVAAASMALEVASGTATVEPVESGDDVVDSIGDGVAVSGVGVASVAGAPVAGSALIES